MKPNNNIETDEEVKERLKTLHKTVIMSKSEAKTFLSAHGEELDGWLAKLGLKRRKLVIREG